MVRKYVSGRVVEKSKFWVTAQTRPRKRKAAASSERKQDENGRSAVKQLARLINCNFVRGDIWLTLNYTDAALSGLGAGADRDEVKKAAEHQLENWLRRCRRKLGENFFYIAATSDMDGETGEAARPHHHVLIPAWAEELCVKEWKLGRPDVQHLRDQEDYTPIAVYICRQCRRQANARRWRPSRNLKRPVITEEECLTRAPLRPAPGAKVLDMGRYDEESGNHYIRYVPKKRRRSDE